MKFSKLQKYMAAIPIVYAATFSGDIHAYASGNSIQFEGTIDAAELSYCTVTVNESNVDMTVDNPLFPTQVSGTSATDGLSVDTNDTGVSIFPTIISETFPTQNAGSAQSALTLNSVSGTQALTSGTTDFEVGMTITNTGSGNLAAGTYTVNTDFTCTSMNSSEGTSLPTMIIRSGSETG